MLPGQSGTAGESGTDDPHGSEPQGQENTGRGQGGPAFAGAEASSFRAFHGRLRGYAVFGAASGIFHLRGAFLPDAENDLRRGSDVAGEADAACIQGAGLE